MEGLKASNNSHRSGLQEHFIYLLFCNVNVSSESVPLIFCTLKYWPYLLYKITLDCKIKSNFKVEQQLVKGIKICIDKRNTGIM